MLHGIDVHAQYQSGLNAASLPGVDFVITKCTGGDSLVIDGWRDMLSGMSLTGIYHFAQDRGYGGTAKAEAAHFVSQARHAPQDALLILDWEQRDTNLGDTAWVLEWCQAVEAALGRRPVIYTGHSVLVEHSEWARVIAGHGYFLWYACYPTNEHVGWLDWEKPDVPNWPSAQVVMWQYSHKGRLSGWDEDIDLNIFYGSAEDWCALAGAKPLVNPAVAERARVAELGRSLLGALDYNNDRQQVTLSELRRLGMGDCSDFTFAVYHEVGRDIGGMSRDQAHAGVEIASWEGDPSESIAEFNKVLHLLRTGDLIVMANLGTREWTHVELNLYDGMALGHGGPGRGPTEHNLGIPGLLPDCMRWTVRRIIQDQFVKTVVVEEEIEMKFARAYDGSIAAIVDDVAAIPLNGMFEYDGLKKIADASKGALVQVTDAEYSGIVAAYERLNLARSRSEVS
ncbi:MAG: GH25 family lysozyme [Ancrocorticia sp.]